MRKALSEIKTHLAKKTIEFHVFLRIEVRGKDLTNEIVGFMNYECFAALRPREDIGVFSRAQYPHQL